MSQVQPLTPPLLDHVVQALSRQGSGRTVAGGRDVTRELRWIAQARSEPPCRDVRRVTQKPIRTMGAGCDGGRCRRHV